MTTKRVIAVSKDIYNEPISTETTSDDEKKKVSITLYLPPSDIPISISSELNEGEDTLILSFKYLDAEKEKELFTRDGIKLMVGVYSGKPLRIEVQRIEKENIAQVEINRITKVIEDNVSNVTGVRERANLARTEKIVRINAAEIVEQARL